MFRLKLKTGVLLKTECLLKLNDLQKLNLLKPTSFSLIILCYETRVFTYKLMFKTEYFNIFRIKKIVQCLLKIIAKTLL